MKGDAAYEGKRNNCFIQRHDMDLEPLSFASKGFDMHPSKHDHRILLFAKAAEGIVTVGSTTLLHESLPVNNLIELSFIITHIIWA